MNTMSMSLSTSLLLLLTSPSFAASTLEPPSTQGPSPHSIPRTQDQDRYAHRCQGRAPERSIITPGTALWGTKRSWTPERKADERRSVLVSVDLTPLPLANSEATTLDVFKGHLLATPRRPGGVVGLVLSGTTSDGKPVEVAICGAEPNHEDPSMRWYRIEAWNPIAREWENPCSVSDDIPDPRALPVQGVWDASGAHHKARDKITLACENGAIARCMRWGYKPWESREGKPLADFHQACTRMARADYCGNGTSHLQESAIIDMYDALGVLKRTMSSTAVWNTARASFEAAWVPDGAFCMARTRAGEDLAGILRECPGRFSEDGQLVLTDGDFCIVSRRGLSPDTVLLRNRSYLSHAVTGLPDQVK